MGAIRPSFFCLLGLLCLTTTSALTFDQIKGQVKLDAQWIDARARDMVDLIFVMDRSGSVSRTQFADSKKFVKNFLDYFSIASQHTQVGIVLFETNIYYPVPLRFDNHKCNFMKELENNVPTNTGGRTNANGGLSKALDVLRQNSRRNTGAFGVVVFITDGYYNDGGNPINIVNALKSEGVLLIVITIGAANQEILGWASKDNLRKAMAFPLGNFTQFVQLANYIHKGQQASKFLTIKDKGECGNKCNGGATCMCDTLGSRGALQCGCEVPGNYIKPVNGMEICDKCPKGQYQEEKNVNRVCKNCPKGQTTAAVQSAHSNQCICAVGYWNRNDHSRIPLNTVCDQVTCARDSIRKLDQHNIELNGQCQYIYGKSCDYRCHSGYITGGVTTRKCEQDGTMNPPPAQCTALLCPVMPAVPESAGWKCVASGQSLGANTYPYRSQCKNQCNPGFLPRPGTNEFIICGLGAARAKGKWSGSTLICEPRKCTNLPEVLNGQYNIQSCSNPDLDDRTFGKVCKVQCNHGYLISEDVEWVCGVDGQWSNYNKDVKCQDIKAPEIITCPQHITLDNEENEGYAVVKLKPLEAFDNDRSSSIKQTMELTMPGTSKPVLYQCNKVECGDSTFNFPVGTTQVKFTVMDRSGNTGSCSFQITVRDVEPPIVVQCDGPKTDAEGFIYSKTDTAQVTWPEPVFTDNSGEAPQIFSTGSPGEYRVGRPWTFTYTARDKAGNTAKCEFSFKLTGIRCPQLHRPANGALVCDKLSFGVYCVPQCEKGLDRLLPVTITRKPRDYFCSLKGQWIPHNTVGDCSLSVPVTEANKPEFEFSWYEGNCQDEATKEQIIENTLTALQNGGPSITGLGFQASHGRGLTKDDFEVFCGPKNESIIQIGGGGARKRRALLDADRFVIAEESDLS